MYIAPNDGLDPRQPASPAPTDPEVTTADILEYLADLILELQALAAPHQLATLTGLLSLAHREALVQIGLVKAREGDDRGSKTQG